MIVAAAMTMPPAWNVVARPSAGMKRLRARSVTYGATTTAPTTAKLNSVKTMATVRSPPFVQARFASNAPRPRYAIVASAIAMPAQRMAISIRLNATALARLSMADEAALGGEQQRVDQRAEDAEHEGAHDDLRGVEERPPLHDEIAEAGVGAHELGAHDHEERQAEADPQRHDDTRECG